MDEVTGSGENYIVRSLMICIPHCHFLGDKSRIMRWAGHVARMGRGEVYRGFRRGHVRERDHLGDPGVDGKIKLRWFFWKWDAKAWTGPIWLRIGTGGGHL